MYRCVNGGGLISKLTSGTNSTLLPMPAAAATAQLVFIEGTVTVDTDYAFASGSDLIFAPGSKLVVQAYKKLTLNGAVLRGCNAMWEGIDANYGSTLEIKGGTIKDALIAAELLFSDPIPNFFTSFGSVGCTYTGNGEAISMRSTSDWSGYPAF